MFCTSQCQNITVPTMTGKVQLTRVFYYNGKSYSPTNIKTVSEKISHIQPKIFKTTSFLGHSTWTLHLNGENVPNKDNSRLRIILYCILTVILITVIAFTVALWISHFPTPKISRKINLMYVNFNMKHSATLLKNDTLTKVETSTVSSICSTCTTNQVCLQNPGQLRPICKIIKDDQDPTGCGGLCLINSQYCRLLDSKHNIRACLNVQKGAGVRDCAPGQFRCKNDASICLPRVAICDGFIHCPDKSDEINCGKRYIKRFLFSGGLN